MKKQQKIGLLSSLLVLVMGSFCVPQNGWATDSGATGGDGTTVYDAIAKSLAESGYTGSDTITISAEGQISVKNMTQGTDGSLSLGSRATASGDGALAVGGGAKATGKGAVALGGTSQAKADSSSAIGVDNYAYAYQTTAVGYNNKAGDADGTSSNFATAMGAQNKAVGYYNVALGGSNKATGSAYSSAVGVGNESSGSGASAFGMMNTASQKGSVAMGMKNTASGEYASALGGYNTAAGENSTAAGQEVKVYGENSASFGYNNIVGATITDEGTKETTIDTTKGNNTYVFGASNEVLANKAFVFGAGNTINSYLENDAAQDANVFVVGSNNNFTAKNAIVLGSGVKTVANDSVVIGDGSTSEAADTVSVGNSTKQRKIVHVADGVADTDAATVGQLKDALVSAYSGSDTVSITKENDKNVIRVKYMAVGEAITYQLPTATGENALAVGIGSDANGDYATALGVNNAATGANAVSVGTNNTATGKKAVAMGQESKALADYSVSLGKDNTTYGISSTAVGVSNDIGTYGDGKQSTAVGYYNTVYGTQSNGVGYWNYIEGNFSSGFGGKNTVNGNQSTAVGYNNSLTGTQSVAAGTENKVTKSGSATVGYRNWNYGYASAIYGSGNYTNGDYSAAIGYANGAVGAKSSAVGYGNYVTGEKSAAFGSDNEALAVNATAVGVGNIVMAAQGMAFGYNAYVGLGDSPAVGADATGAVAIGNETVNTEAGTVSFGHKKGDFTGLYSYTDEAGNIYYSSTKDADFNTPVTYGSDRFARLTNVADGTVNTDAATYGQLVNAQAVEVDSENVTYTAYELKAGEETEIKNNAGGTAFKLKLNLKDGQIATGDDGSGYVTGKAVYDELRPADSQTYHYIGKTKEGGTKYTTAENLIALDTQVKANADAISGINTDITTLTGDVSTMKTDVSSMKTDVSAIKENIEGMSSQLDGLRLDGGQYVFSKDDNTKAIQYANNGGTAFTITINGLGEGGGGTDYNAGNGIAIQDNEISVKVAEKRGLTVDENGLGVKVAEKGGLTVDENGLGVKVAENGGLTVDEKGLAVQKDGKVESGNTGIVTGGTVYDAIAGKTGDTTKLSAAGLGDNLTDSVLTVNDKIGSLSADINKVGAGAAALAALRPEGFDPDDKWSFAVGYGHYKNANAGALGAFFKPNADTTLSLGGTIGNGDSMMNAGVSFKLGARSDKSVYRTEGAVSQELAALRKNNDKLTAQNAAQQKEISALRADNEKIKADNQRIKEDNERIQKQILLILSKIEMSDMIKRTEAVK